ncbi:hypothetical protein BLS_007266 [Venturia inaequalis]|uniref:Zn(2)-C6 fungal-type domain-containing protein n=2 Tax=Venturia inaequalis TaxID=5025 RepID=A0A8H3UAH6_VENIN|nr:hypothetical protein BLS_007266 [Venturia inaequalis]
MDSTGDLDIELASTMHKGTAMEISEIMTQYKLETPVDRGQRRWVEMALGMPDGQNKICSVDRSDSTQGSNNKSNWDNKLKFYSRANNTLNPSSITWLTPVSPSEYNITLRSSGVLSQLGGSNNVALSSQHPPRSSVNKADSGQNFSTQRRHHGQGNINKMADILLHTKRKHDERQSDDRPNTKKMKIADKDSSRGSGSEGNHPAVCKPCRAQKKGCEETRPCSRCVKAGVPELCVPTVPKTKRRPRYRDEAERRQLIVDAVSLSSMHDRQSGDVLTEKTRNKARPEPISRSSLDPLAASPVNHQNMRHPRDPRSRLQDSGSAPRMSRPSPTLAPSTSHRSPFTPTTRPAYTNPMIEPPLVSLPSLIRGRGRGVHIMDLRDLVSDGQTILELATQNQHSLIQLRENNPPAAGYWPPVLLDSEWSEKTKAIPEHVNCLVHIPETEYGDFWGLFSAPTTKTQGHREATCVVETPQKGKMLWACLGKNVVNAVRYNNGSWLKKMKHMDKPIFLPGTVGFQHWTMAAETWICGYELPVAQEYVCYCRRRRGDCLVKDMGTFAFGKTMVKEVHDGKTNYAVKPLMVVERTIRCQAGERCGNREYHLSCLGIPEAKWEGILLEVKWWCPVCRERWPEEAKGGVIIEGERLELRVREHEPKPAKPRDSEMFGPQPVAEAAAHGWFDLAGEPES